MNKLQFFVLFGICGLALSQAQTVSSNSINSGSLQGSSVAGSITSTVGEFVAGSVNDEEAGSISQGFSQSYLNTSTPVQLLAIARVAINSWSSLLGTKADIEVCNLNGSVLQKISTGLSQAQLIGILQELPPSVYLLRSGKGSDQARMIFSPSIR